MIQLEFPQHLRRWVANCCLTVMGLTACYVQGAIARTAEDWTMLAKEADPMTAQPGRPSRVHLLETSAELSSPMLKVVC